MTKDDSEEDQHADFPEKMRKRIRSAPDPDEKADPYVGNEEDGLRSDRPVHVVEYYLSRVRSGTDATWTDYSYDLTRFLEYCEYAHITDLSTLSESDIEGFTEWRQRDEYVKLTSLHGQLANIRVFIRYCERIELIDKELADEIELPNLDKTDMVDYTRISTEEAEAILEYYDQFDYASRAHAEFALMWALLCRRGGCRALDLGDYREDDDGNMYIDLVHRPEKDTTLKNGAGDIENEGGERQINLPDWVARIVDDYIAENRIDVTDEYGREPLFATKHGRVSKSTIQRDIYGISQPCQYGVDCPHDREESECEARTNADLLSQCPSSVSPHPVRRGGICHQIQEGVPKELICDRADVSLEVLNRHYDIRTKEEARKQRREELKEHLDGYESTDSENGDADDDHHDKLAEISPAAADLLMIKDRFGSAMQTRDLSRARLVKGMAGYVAFVILTGIDLGLIGIGFDPTTLKLIVSL